jgi:hypothetical protein
MAGVGQAVRPFDHRALPAGVRTQRRARPGVPPGGLVPARDRGRHTAHGRAAGAALRCGRLPGHGLGRRPARRSARGRAHAVHVRRHRRAGRRGGEPARGGRACRGPADRRDAAARQAGLAGRAARDLVPPHDRDLAAGVVRARTGDARVRPAVDAGRRRRPGARRDAVEHGPGSRADGRGAPATRRRGAGRAAVPGRGRPRGRRRHDPGARQRPGRRQAALVARAPHAGAGTRRGARRRQGRQQSRGRCRQLPRPAVDRHRRRAFPAQRAPVLHALGARAGVLAGVTPGRSRPGRTAP